MMTSRSAAPERAYPRTTLVLTREMIVRTMKFADYVDAVEDGFRRHAAAKVVVPEVVHIAEPGGGFHIKSAGFTEDPQYVAVKVNGNFPDNQKSNGLPTIQGAITLCDGRNGFPLAILDSGEVTAQRTAAATAVAAKFLANPDSTVATIVGCGIQGRMQLLALLHVLPLRRVFAFDTDNAACRIFADEMSASTGVEVTPLEAFADGTRQSQVIVTCTSSKGGYLQQRHVQPGTFIAAVGADSDDKQELDSRLLRSSVVIVDILEQCAHIGELHHALIAGDMDVSQVFANLGEVAAGTKVHNCRSGDTIIFDSTGSAIQDVAAAGMIYERALEQGLGLQAQMS